MFWRAVPRCPVICETGNRFGFRDVLLEPTALPFITNREVAQVLNYLKITKLETGLILNFG